MTSPSNQGVNLLENQIISQAAMIIRLCHDLDQLAHEATDTVADIVSRIEMLGARSIRSGVGGADRVMVLARPRGKRSGRTLATAQ